MAYLGLEKTIEHAGELQQLNLWAAEFLPNSAMSAGIPDSVKFRCQSIGLPSQEWTTNEVTLNRFTLTQPARLQRSGEIELKFVDAVDAEVEKWLIKIARTMWSESDNDSTGASIGWKNLKSTLILNLLDSTGKKTTRGYKMVNGIFLPKSLEGELGSDDSIANLSLTFKYTWWYPLVK